MIKKKNFDKKIVELVKDQKSIFIRQRKILEMSLMAAQNERIELCDKLLHKKVDKEYYVKRQKHLHDYINKFFMDMGKEAKRR